MTEPFHTFKIFRDSESAKALAELLQQHNIPCYIEDDGLVFDPSYANNPLLKDYLVQVRQADFTRANIILEEHYRSLSDEVEPDYYLLSFSDEELQEILAKPDEWGAFDYQLARRLLQERGKEIEPEQIEALKRERITELAKPSSVRNSSIVVAYLLSIFIPFSLITGWVWGYSRKTLPDGQRVYLYEAGARRHGRIIFGIGLFLLLFTVFRKVLPSLP